MNLLALLSAAACAATLSPAGPTPAGHWQTVNRADNTPAGIVELTIRNNTLSGRITQVYDPARRTLRCTRCTDDRRDAPFLGLEILRNLHQEGDTWTGGTVLDPDTGNTYRATIHLSDPAHLTIRGYLGISLFGGSQTWTRID